MLCMMSLPCNQPAWNAAMHPIVSAVSDTVTRAQYLFDRQVVETLRREKRLDPLLRVRLVEAVCEVAQRLVLIRHIFAACTDALARSRSQSRGHRWIERGAGGRHSTLSDALGSALRFFGSAAFDSAIAKLAFFGVAFFGFSFSSPSSSESSFSPGFLRAARRSSPQRKKHSINPSCFTYMSIKIDE